jgi:hypothetical protein
VFSRETWQRDLARAENREIAGVLERGAGLITVPGREGTLRGEDGTWRFRSHVVRPVFLGSDRPLSLSINGQFLSRRRERIA